MRKMKLTIGTKLIMGFGVVAVLLAILAFYSTIISQKTLEESVGRSSLFLAREMLTRIDESIYDRIEEIQKFTKGTFLQKTLLKSNADFEKLDSIEEYIKQKDREWTAVPLDELTPFMQNLIQNDLSHVLREEFIEFYEKKYGYKVFAEVFLTSRYGANVAQTGRTSDYRQDDEEWWQGAREKGFFVGDVYYDESAGTYGIEIGVRINDEKGNFIGVVKAVVAAEEIIREAEITTKAYETTEIEVLTKDGGLIYSNKPFKFLEDVTLKDFFKKLQGESGSFISKEGSRERLFSYIRSKGYQDYEGLQWIYLINHDVKEVLGSAFILRNNILIISLILIVASILIAFILSRSIVTPVIKVRNTALEIAQGNLDKRVKISSNDEIGELAAAFNEMTSKLHESYINLKKEVTEHKRSEEELEKYRKHLEELVKERTTELEEKTKTLEKSQQSLASLFEDVNEAKEKLENVNKKLETSNKELEAFSYSVSHDLRAPLRAIDGFTRILMEDYMVRLDAEGKRLGRIIQQNTKKMGQLIDDLLAFSHMGRASMSFSEIDMKKMANAIYHEATNAEVRKRITFTIADLSKAEGDTNMMRQVWMNFISNAIKFSAHRKQAVISVSCQEEENKLTYCIKDNGVGFNMKYKDKLFGVFQRLHSEKEFEGTGVGLALVQRIIHRHGGEVWANGEVDNGAAFYFSLPKKRRT